MARVAWYTDAGVRGPTNQDALCAKVAATAMGEASMAVVCDGVGGLDRGEVASASVARLFSDWFDEDLALWLAQHAVGDQVGLLGLRGVWTRLLRRANAALELCGRKAGGLMGTTVTGVFCLGGRYLLGHVGDCRAYLVGACGTRRLTQDQTLAEREVSLGRMGEEEVRRSPQRSVLLQAVGTQASLEPVFHQGRYRRGELLVLASDGAWQLQGDGGIDRALRPLLGAGEGELSRACEGICRSDMQRGERDNLTIVCLGPDLREDLGASLDTTASGPVSGTGEAPAGSAGVRDVGFETVRSVVRAGTDESVPIPHP